MAIKFKVRDTVTKKFWNGDIRRSSFSDKGKLWGTRKMVEATVGYYIQNHTRWSNYYKQEAHNPPKQWEIVEIELVEKETTTHSMTDFLRYTTLKEKVEHTHRGAGYFIEKMHSKGVLDKIQYLIKLKPAKDTHWIDMDRIKEAREQLRQLGVMTRSFRETSGYFGMIDRDQAMKARLVLDIDWMLDLQPLRDAITI